VFRIISIENSYPDTNFHRLKSTKGVYYRCMSPVYQCHQRQRPDHLEMNAVYLTSPSYYSFCGQWSGYPSAFPHQFGNGCGEPAAPKTANDKMKIQSKLPPSKAAVTR
jgi:hypothetical protein